MENHSYGNKAKEDWKDLFIIYLVKTAGDYNMIYGQIFYASEGKINLSIKNYFHETT